jgi:hypothetical protein
MYLRLQENSKDRENDRIGSESLSWVMDPRIRIRTNIVRNTDPNLVFGVQSWTKEL